ncbi:MAG: DUF3793 family protein [Lachnospiraceae bacterium]|nr:DUF3793 family protein [Lachnospiraceae bacterium]
MSYEMLELFRNMDFNDTETQLALQCAPLLTGLKMSNLFIISTENERNFLEYLDRATHNVDIEAYRLLEHQGKSIYLLYRKEQLEHFLAKEEVRDFFAVEGYYDFTLEGILLGFRFRYQKHRLCGGDFPHEMGLLLGYPLEDVVGFVENEGEHFLCSGYWKVYANPAEKLLLFRKFQCAEDRLIKLLSKGISIKDMIV